MSIVERAIEKAKRNGCTEEWYVLEIVAELIQAKELSRKCIELAR
jgi:hypothetical protein